MTASSSRSGRAIATFLTFMFHTVVQGGFQEAAKIYIYFLDNSLLFQTLKKMSKSVDEVIAKIRHHTTFFETVE